MKIKKAQMQNHLNQKRFFMRKSFILLLAFFLCVTGYAQKLTISGVVIDKDLNEPLTGVNVLVKGTTTGTITDFDGK